jgi:hypothetical protein
MVVVVVVRECIDQSFVEFRKSQISNFNFVEVRRTMKIREKCEEDRCQMSPRKGEVHNAYDTMKS